MTPTVHFSLAEAAKTKGRKISARLAEPKKTSAASDFESRTIFCIWWALPNGQENPKYIDLCDEDHPIAGKKFAPIVVTMKESNNASIFPFFFLFFSSPRRKPIWNYRHFQRTVF